MSRNVLLAVIAALTLCTVGISFLFHRKRHPGIEIRIGEQGLTIDENRSDRAAAKPIATTGPRCTSHAPP